MTKKRKIELVGMDSLTIIEARCLIKAAIAGRFQVMPGDVYHVDDAVTKVAKALINSGQDKETVQAFIDSCYH